MVERSRTLLLPSRNTFGLLAVLAAMWYAGVAQSNGAAHLLCFLLAALAVLSTLPAWENLRALHVQAGPIAPVFAGDTLAIPLSIAAPRGAAGVEATAGPGAPAPFFTEAPASAEERATIPAPAPARGFFRTVSITLHSRYPLGFFTARRRITLAQEYRVYPRPAGSAPLPREVAAGRDRREGLRGEGDDFAGLRPWLPGESQRHIDWKAAARGQPLLTKQWAGEGAETVMLAWDATPGADAEARLSQLAQWIIAAERAGFLYALRIPGTTIEPAHGEAHFHRCLRALADFPREP